MNVPPDGLIHSRSCGATGPTGPENLNWVRSTHEHRYEHTVTPFLLPAEPITSLDAYLATQTGGRGVQRAQEIGPDATIDEVTRSGLRGRGGGGFPTGQKWAGIAAQAGTRRYLVCNGAEGEPGTFKDRALLRANPYQLVEGLVIAAFAVGADEAFICLKASFEREIANVTRAVQEFQEAGICTDCTVTVVAGPEEYLFGEEKAMLEVIEGNEPLPRWLPPHLHGLFATSPQLGWESSEHQPGEATDSGSNPTLVNNVETLSNIAHILAHGATWFRSMGTAESPGTIITTVVGDVIAPDVGEVEMGTPLRAVIEAVGSGVAPGRTVKAVFSGVANAVVTAADLDVPISFEGFAAIGSGMGSAGFIVYDDTACMVNVAYMFSRFLSVESCGQCPPCKLGSSSITEHLERLETGAGADEDIAAIGRWIEHVTDGNRCYLPVEEQIMVSSILRSFPQEFAEHIELQRCPRPRRLPLPKLVDLGGGQAVYDESFWRKRPDWTSATESAVEVR
jgi:NADH-quinone oxidoreductase subunit F